MTEIASVALAQAPTAGAATGATGAAANVQAGYGVSLTDFGGFQQALAQASARLEAQPVNVPGQAAQMLFQPFEHINASASQLAADAQLAQSVGKDLTPGQMIAFSARCQEFMFHSQLLSNMANRTSDGLQQLFRQQS
jgi:hypothetical protein